MPQCATCNEYVTADFVRVFGNNDNVVESCLSCRGEHPAEDDEPEQTDENKLVMTLDTSGRWDDSADASTADSPNEPESGATAGAAGADRPMADGTPIVDGGVERSATPDSGRRSRFGFLRAVFSR